MRWVLTATVVVAVGLLTSILAANLPRDTFFNGDPGVKLIATRAALAHPRRPLQIDLPTIGGKRFPFLDPFFLLHGDHAHAATSEAFVLASAPLVAAFGVAGAYVLPFVGFLAVMIGCAWLGVALDGRRNPAIIAAVAAVCTPFVFYGLEFWEHAPALGAASVGTALLVSARDDRGRAVVAGALLGAAVLLRPEALWFLVAIAAALPLSPKRPAASAVWTALAAGVVMLLPLTAYAVIHFGSLTTPHVSGNMAAVSYGWWRSRTALAAAWFTPSRTHIDFWSVAPVTIGAFVPLPNSSRRSGRTFLLLVAAIYAILVVGTAPNDGGAQWGPRYLLFAYVPLAILIADVLSWMATSRLWVMAAVVVVLWSAWIDRAAYKDLRTSKRIYARIDTFVERQSDSGEPIVTDVWWLDQIAAKLWTSRVFLYAGTPDRQRALVEALDSAHVPRIVLVTSGDESPRTPGEWVTGTSYVAQGSASITDRHLTIVHLQRRPPRN